jgi:hypothetical protein
VLNTLTVRLHHAANACTDNVLGALCEKVNDTKTLISQNKSQANLCAELKLNPRYPGVWLAWRTVHSPSAAVRKQ